MNIRLLAAASLSLVLASHSVGQGRGQGGGPAGGGTQSGPQGGPQGGPQAGGRPDTAPGAAQGQGQPQRKPTAEERSRMRATTEQRAQYNNCTQEATRVRDQARAMAEAAKGGGANNDEFRRLHQQLQQSIRSMQQEHDRFMLGLNADQRPFLQDRVRSMDQARDRLNQRIAELDAEMAKPEVDRKRIRDRATAVEKATNEWQKQVRKVGSDIGL